MFGMKKEHILAEIRRTAEANGGEPGDVFILLENGKGWILLVEQKTQEGDHPHGEEDTPESADERAVGRLVA